MVTWTGSARNLFDAARSAAMECERTRRMLLAMELREGGSGGEGAKVNGGSVSDPMRRVDARLDMEAQWGARIEENEQLMDYATCVLYGRDQDGKGGITALLGSACADALWWHYLGCETWVIAAHMVGYSDKWCKQMRSVAFDLIDSVGADEVMNGRGLAED